MLFRSEPVGFMAQEVATVVPEAVFSESVIQENHQYIEQTKLNELVIKALQESPDVKINTVEISANNLTSMEEPSGNTKYDYSDPYSFREKDKQ